MDQLLSDQPQDEKINKIYEIIQKVGTTLREGKATLASLVITKQLSKNPNEYPDKKTPHVVIALRLNAQGGRMWKAGDTVPYIICDVSFKLYFHFKILFVLIITIFLFFCNFLGWHWQVTPGKILPHRRIQKEWQFKDRCQLLSFESNLPCYIENLWTNRRDWWCSVNWIVRSVQFFVIWKKMKLKNTRFLMLIWILWFQESATFINQNEQLKNKMLPTFLLLWTIRGSNIACPSNSNVPMILAIRKLKLRILPLSL